jgi:putative transposase
MARPLRIEFPGALYHVTARGNARAPIYHSDADRLLFLDVNERIRRACRDMGYSYSEVGRHLGLHCGTISRIVAVE